MVIKSFGNLITQGNLVIGILIFLIIVLVQFIVITKGAERVSEVAARFTLDAMPGKQMAIDADLSSGLIDEKEARLRRYKIQKEADFYGAMDGATKIVKGDAIMSLIITAINFVAGLIIGVVQGGSDLATVLNVYSIATIGDGLVSQLPGADDLHRHRHDRHPVCLRRQSEYRRAEPVQGPAPGHSGHRRHFAAAGPLSRNAHAAAAAGGRRPECAGAVGSRKLEQGEEAASGQEESGAPPCRNRPHPARRITTRTSPMSIPCCRWSPLRWSSDTA